jgi:signal transduction histidine kinase
MAPSAVRTFHAGIAGQWRSLSPGMKDASFAIFLALFTQVELMLADEVAGPMLVQSVSFAVMTLAVAWRRTAPLLAAALTGTAMAVQTLAGEAPVVGGFIAVLIVTYSVASYAPRRTALLGGAFVLLGVFTYPLVHDTNFADEVGNLAIFVGAWVLGRAVRSRQRRAVEAENQVLVIEREREQTMRAAIADERARIARELHDIVAHGVSVMVLQAGAARQTLDRDPGKVRQLLVTVEQMGRQSLEEMHRMLGVLRRTGEDVALEPPLTLGAIGQLLDDVRQTGLTVDCRIEGDQRPLGPGLEVSAYRIVQESLTNTLKHTDATSAEVTLRYRTDALELTVTDDGHGSSDPDDRGGGRGLIGMRERAELFGGTITAGPAQPHGWRVAVRLPVDGQS